MKALRGVVMMADARGLLTVAEWVETTGQADRLREVGCTYLQGYLFSRPAPLERPGAGAQGREGKSGGMARLAYS